MHSEVRESRKGLYLLAGVRVEVSSLYPDVHLLLKDYTAGGEADFRVSTDAADIEQEQEKSRKEALLEGISPRVWPAPYLEELAVYRKIAEQMPFYDTLLIHGSALAVEGKAFLFCAKSGTGKSTHTRLWRQLLGEKARMLNDDKPLLHIPREGAPLCYGTPYDGKHHLSTNAQAPLKAVGFIERSPENHTVALSPREVFPLLLQQIYHPENPAAMARSLELLRRLTESISFYRVLCNQDLEAAAVAYRTMRE